MAQRSRRRPLIVASGKDHGEYQSTARTGRRPDPELRGLRDARGAALAALRGSRPSSTPPRSSSCRPEPACSTAEADRRRRAAPRRGRADRDADPAAVAAVPRDDDRGRLRGAAGAGSSRSWPRDGRCAGRKIGLTSRAMQQAVSITEPDYGAIFDDMFFDDGGVVPTGGSSGRGSRSSWRSSSTGRCAGPGVTLFDVLDATALRHARRSRSSTPGCR